MYDYADIRNMRDSKDKFYSEEISFWNEYKPKFDLLFNPFYKLCIKSEFKDKLKEMVPENFFNTIEVQLKINSDAVVDLQKRENELKMEYRKIFREKILYDGEERNLSYISGFFSNKDRNVRKQAFKNRYNALSKYSSILASNYEAYIKADSMIAKTRGYKSTLEMYLYPDGLTEEIYDNLLKVANDNICYQYKYFDMIKIIVTTIQKRNCYKLRERRSHMMKKMKRLLLLTLCYLILCQTTVNTIPTNDGIETYEHKEIETDD